MRRAGSVSGGTIRGWGRRVSERCAWLGMGGGDLKRDELFEGAVLDLHEDVFVLKEITKIFAAVFYFPSFR